VKVTPEQLRPRVVKRVELWLHSQSSPRLHMALIVGATGGTGLLFSLLLLKMGLVSMMLRYPLAVGFAYVVFLFLLRFWLALQTGSPTPVVDRVADSALDGTPDMLEAWANSPSTVATGGGSSGGGHELPFDLDVGELFFVLVALAALCAGLIVSLYVIWTGPGLLAEVLVDGLVMERIYRNMQRTNPSDWVSSAFRRTRIPALLIAIFFAVVGFALQAILPEAHSIGPVLTQLISGR